MLYHMRAVIHFTEEQAQALRRVTEREHISRNEAVCRAVERCYGTGSTPATRDQLFRRMIGLWRGRGIDTDAYIQEIRTKRRPSAS